MNTTFQEYPKWVGDVIVHSREEEAALAADKEKVLDQIAQSEPKKRTRKAAK